MTAASRSPVSLAIKYLERFNKLTFSCETALCQDIMISERKKKSTSMFWQCLKTQDFVLAMHISNAFTLFEKKNVFPKRQRSCKRSIFYIAPRLFFSSPHVDFVSDKWQEETIRQNTDALIHLYTTYTFSFLSRPFLPKTNKFLAANKRNSRSSPV